MKVNFVNLLLWWCPHIAVVGNSLYWSVLVDSSSGLQTAFYSGDTSCDNCAAPSPFATFQGSITDFQVSNGILYYSVSGVGIQSISLNSSDFSAAEVFVSATNVNSFQIIEGRLYYNDNAGILGIDLDGTSLYSVANSTTAESSCECSQGFSGENCDQCPSGSTQWSDGQAYCVPIDASTGFPSSCFADYQCGQIPFVQCSNNVCTCATGAVAIPPSCSSCSDGSAILWSNEGLPSCA